MRATADVSVSHLLEEVGVPDLDYYSAGDERAIAEALRAWPLLAAVTRALESGAHVVNEEALKAAFRVIAPREEREPKEAG